MAAGLTLVIAEAFSTDIYQITAELSGVAFGTSVLIVLAAALISGWLVKRDIDRPDLVAALKSRE